MNLRSRTARRLTAATAAACAIVAVPAAMAVAAPARPGSPASTAARITPACQTPGLVIWMDTSGNAAAGSTFYKMFFTNQSGHSCTLNGFPFVFAVGLQGKQIGRRAGFNGPAPHQITIANHGTATATLQIVNVGNFPVSSCHPVWAAGLNVFPPNQTRAKVIPFPFRACSSTAPPFLSVGAVK